MQNYCKTIGALAAASTIMAGTASAEIEYAINAGYTNEYVWRGLDLGDDLVTAGVDAATEWNGLGLSAGAWHATFDAASAKTTELDLYGEASKDLGFATFAVGYIKYINENINGATVDDAQEIYFGVSRDFGFAEASLTYYWDIETDNEGYTELGLNRSFELNSCTSLGLSTALGYAIEQSQFVHWTTTASIDWAFTETATLSPFVTVSAEGEASTGDYYNNANNVELIGGATLAVSF